MSDLYNKPNNEKIILDLCGGSGAWSRPYREEGYKVINVTLPEYDVRTYEPPDNVYGILAAPPCTMFSFARMKAKIPRNLPEGMEIVKACLDIILKCQYRIEKDTQKYSPLRFWALENPKGMLEWFLGNPVLTFQPYEYGDAYKKLTCIWGMFRIPKKTHMDVFNVKNIGKFQGSMYRQIAEIHGTELKGQDLASITPSGFAKAFFWANQ